MNKSDVRRWSVVTGMGLAALVLSGCITAPPPTRSYVRPGPNHETLLPQVKRMGVITDAAVRYDRSGTNDYFCIEDSLAALTNIVSEAVNHLQSKGYEIAFGEACFIGSFKECPQALRVSQKRQDKPVERSAPFYVNPSLSSDEAYRKAVQRVVQRAHEAVINAGELPSETFTSDPGVRESLKVIATQKQVDYLLVTVGDGLLVSAGKQVGQALASSLASIFITAGNAVVTAHNVSFLDSSVALLNLQTGEVLWSNSLRIVGNPAEPGFYKGNWARFLLYHMPDRNAPKKT